MCSINVSCGNIVHKGLFLFFALQQLLVCKEHQFASIDRVLLLKTTDYWKEFVSIDEISFNWITINVDIVSKQQYIGLNKNRSNKDDQNYKLKNKYL